MEIKKKLGLIFGILGIFLCLVMNANALTITHNQETTQSKYISDYFISKTSHNIVGNLDLILGTANSSQNFTYDYKIEFLELNKPFYLSFYNVKPQNITLMWKSLNADRLAGGSPDVIVQPFQLNEIGTYRFYFEPTETEQIAIIYLDIDINSGDQTSASVGTLEIAQTGSRGINHIFKGLIDGLVLIIDVNIAFWKLGYYLVVFVLALTSVLILFSLAFILFKVMKTLKQNSQENHKKTRDKEDN